jgi:hypothetical protein
MSQGSKRLEAMRRNPQGDWRIEDIALVCATCGFDCEPPKRGSHYTISHPAAKVILTIPYNRPVKPVYIRLLLAYIDGVQGAPT